ncbi:MAG: sulfite exporter TauE/SafE family protein [Promethearchaeia archaeon]
MTTLEVMLLLAVLALICEYVDATLGMGFGTILSPALIILGYLPIVFVPVVLFSQFLGGIVSSILHHNLENMQLSGEPRERQALVVFLITGMLGVIFSTIFMIVLPSIYVEIYIAAAVTAMGLVMLWTNDRRFTYSPVKLAAMGLIAAFNKGISGGGYGPITVGGQMLSDIPPRAAVAITALVESLICIVGFVIHLIWMGLPDIVMLASLSVGAVIAAPLSAMTIAKLHQHQVKEVVAVSTLTIGLVTLLWVLITGFV